MINRCDSILLLAFLQEGATITTAVQSHRETVFDQPKCDGDSYVLQHLFFFLLKMCHFFRETTVKCVERTKA